MQHLHVFTKLNKDGEWKDLNNFCSKTSFMSLAIYLGKKKNLNIFINNALCMYNINCNQYLTRAVCILFQNWLSCNEEKMRYNTKIQNMMLCHVCNVNGFAPMGCSQTIPGFGLHIVTALWTSKAINVEDRIYSHFVCACCIHCEKKW